MQGISFTEDLSGSFPFVCVSFTEICDDLSLSKEMTQNNSVKHSKAYLGKVYTRLVHILMVACNAFNKNKIKLKNVLPSHSFS